MPKLVPLEDRTAPAVFTVNSTADTPDANLNDGIAADQNGNTTLRAAIQQANQLGGANSILFNIPALDRVISITDPLDQVTCPISIDARGQGGVTLAWAGQGNSVHGFWLTQAGNTVAGLTFSKFTGSAVYLRNANNSAVFSNSFQNNGEGVTLSGSSNCNISSNSFSGNTIGVNVIANAANGSNNNAIVANRILGTPTPPRAEPDRGHRQRRLHRFRLQR